MTVRQSLCLTCRSRLESGEVCELHPHTAVDLGTKAGRERLRQRVWGSPEARARLAEAAQAGAFAGGLGGLGGLDGCFEVGAAIPGLQILVPIVAVFVVVFFLYSTIAWVVRTIRNRKRLPGQPSGVSAWSGKARTLPLSGTVSAAEPDGGAPLSDRRCVAWGVLLTGDDTAGSGPVLLRDGYTTGLEITLDDGRIVRVPRGRCRVVGPTGRHPRRAVDHYLTTMKFPLDSGPDAETFPLFPADKAVEVLVSIGDRVHLRADLAPTDGHYRQVTHFVTAGTVELTAVG